MRMKPITRRLLAALCLSGLVLNSAPLRAAEETMALPTALAHKGVLHFLKPGQPDASLLLAPPPLIDSAEQSADLDEVRSVYHATSEVDKQIAYAEKQFSVFNFTDAVGPFFLATNLPKTTTFFTKVQLDAETVTDLGKDYFKRPRPFMTDTNLANGKLEKSFSYPSGHSTESMVLALVLADLLPGQHDAIIARARTIGWHRVQIARHYPSDIFAGRTLARAIAQSFKQSDAYQKEFAAVKIELEAARTAAKN